MEELTEVVTAADFHPISCNILVYSSSRGSIKLGDMRESALCDNPAKCKPPSYPPPPPPRAFIRSRAY
jgi:serine/threonine-protein phosphatase 2A regulatory subunit B